MYLNTSHSELLAPHRICIRIKREKQLSRVLTWDCIKALNDPCLGAGDLRYAYSKGLLVLENVTWISREEYTPANQIWLVRARCRY